MFFIIAFLSCLGLLALPFLVAVDSVVVTTSVVMSWKEVFIIAAAGSFVFVLIFCIILCVILGICTHLIGCFCAS